MPRSLKKGTGSCTCGAPTRTTCIRVKGVPWRMSSGSTPFLRPQLAFCRMSAAATASLVPPRVPYFLDYPVAPKTSGIRIPSIFCGPLRMGCYIVFVFTIFFSRNCHLSQCKKQNKKKHSTKQTHQNTDAGKRKKLEQARKFFLQRGESSSIDTPRRLYITGSNYISLPQKLSMQWNKRHFNGGDLVPSIA